MTDYLAIARAVEARAQQQTEPVSPSDVEPRIAAYSAHLATWRAHGRTGAPVFVLPGVVAQAGGCVSCGAVLDHPGAWRCRPCLAAIAAVLDPVDAELGQKLRAQADALKDASR